MSDNAWVLKGVDPEIRDRAVEEAARLGVPLADYLTDMVVRAALSEQLTAAAAPEDENTLPGIEDASNIALPPDTAAEFAVRHRIKALERRVGVAVGSLDQTLLDLSERVGDVETQAADTSDLLRQTALEAGAGLTGIRLHVAEVEAAHQEMQAEARERLAAHDGRIGHVEAATHTANRSLAVLADAHEALKQAVATDFSDFAHDLGNRLQHSLSEVRLAANEAAEQADAAVAHLIEELRGVRASLDDRLVQSEADTRARMHAAFADAADRLGTLAERVTDNERFAARSIEQIRAQITDIEDGVLTAVEETAETLRRADGVLASDIASLREDHETQRARLKLVDIGVVDVAEQVQAARSEALSALVQAQTDWDGRFESAHLRTASAERNTLQLSQHLSAEIERIEASAYAALQKLANDIAGGGALAEQRLAETASMLRVEIAQARHSATEGADVLREEHRGALARLSLLDQALTRLEGTVTPLDERIAALEHIADRTLPTRVAMLEQHVDPGLAARVAQLEHAAARAETEQAIATIGAEVAALAGSLDAIAGNSEIADRVNALHARLAHQDAQNAEADERAQDLARVLNRVAAQSVEATARCEGRVQQVELALADFRLEALASHSAAPAEALNTLQQRMEALESGQGRALEQLHASIRAFIDKTDSRLAAFEAQVDHKQASTYDELREGFAQLVEDADRRLSALEAISSFDVATEFAELRKRVDDRILGVEHRSVRTLEQVAETVATIEKRFASAERSLLDSKIA
jgi:hypothetical protein